MILFFFFEYDEKGNEKFLLIGEYPYNVFKDKYKYKKVVLILKYIIDLRLDGALNLIKYIQEI